MSTWWTPAHRADLGLRAGDLPGSTFNLTNRGWYTFFKLMRSFQARSLEQSAKENEYIPSSLAQHWGALLTGRRLDEWLQIGRFDGRSVVFNGIVHHSEADQYTDTCELTPLTSTPLAGWLYGIGQQLAVAPSGLVISGKPRKENPMTLNLTEKGAKVDLTKEAGGTLNGVLIGLGWDVRQTDGPAYDLDASIVVTDASGKSVGQDWFIYFNQLKSPNGAIEHHGDNLTGVGDGDDEQISVNLTQLPDNAEKLVIAVTIFEARKRGGQAFTQVNNAFVRIVNAADGVELARYDLSEDADTGVNCLIFAELYKHGGSWKFKTVGDGFKDEIDGLVRTYGM
jgi:tellurium resistance protein TerD